MKNFNPDHLNTLVKNSSAEQLKDLSVLLNGELLSRAQQLDSTTLKQLEKKGSTPKWSSLDNKVDAIDFKKKRMTMKIVETINNDNVSTAPRMVFNQMG